MVRKSDAKLLQEEILKKTQVILDTFNKDSVLEKQEALKMLTALIKKTYEAAMMGENFKEFKESLELYAKLQSWMEQQKISIPRLTFNLSFADKPTEKIAQKINKENTIDCTEVKELDE